jgi:hypothetical protein
MDAFTSRREVARIETHLIFEHATRPTLPVLMQPESLTPAKRKVRDSGI